MAEGGGGGRQRAWGVLAVTLALMALVAALSSTTDHSSIDPASHDHSVEAGARPGSSAAADDAPSSEGPQGDRAPGSRTTPRRATRHPTPGRSTEAVGAVRSAGSATAGVESPPFGGTVALGAPLSPLGTAEGARGSQTPQGDAPAAVTSKGASAAGGAGATLTTAPSGVPPSGAGGTQAVSTEAGRLGPTGSATYQATGGGTVTADATWTASVSLELSVSCPGGIEVSRSGSSNLSVVVDDTHRSGDCAVTISALPGVTSTIAYTLTIEPAA
jgi:hypothetical protein